MSQNEKEPRPLRYDQEGRDRIAAALWKALPPPKIKVEVEKSEDGGFVSITARIYPQAWEWSNFAYQSTKTDEDERS